LAKVLVQCKASREEEGFYVLEGEITFLIGDPRLKFGEGDRGGRGGREDTSTDVG
jgi:uncharacterized cupin superfamily protein